MHNGYNLSPDLIANIKDLFKPDEKEDTFDVKISDGKNDASTSVKVLIINKNSKVPVLKSSTAFVMRLKELQRKPLTAHELLIEDFDTVTSDLKVIVTNSPQYGTIQRKTTGSELKNTSDDKKILINTGINQTLNLILQFPNNKTTYMPVSEFTMADINAGLIFYEHQVKGVTFDRFGFVIFDGVNKLFRINEKAEQTSNVQIFNIEIDVDRNSKPMLEKNLGLEYLYQIDGKPGRLITNNELSIMDNDDAPQHLIMKITKQPEYGVLENKENSDGFLEHFSQKDIEQNKVYYVLTKELQDDSVTADYFLFDIYDSHGNVVRKNRFDISWSMLSFELSELSVMETDGKARVHIKKTGNLKQFSMITCKTYSETAKSNRDAKNFDYVQTLVRLEFNEDESYKACDIMIQRDMEVEPIESFFVMLDDAKYSIIGSKNKIKVNILDRIKGKSL